MSNLSSGRVKACQARFFAFARKYLFCRVVRNSHENTYYEQTNRQKKEGAIAYAVTPTKCHWLALRSRVAPQRCPLSYAVAKIDNFRGSLIRKL